MIRAATDEAIAHVAMNLRDSEIVVRELGKVGAANRCVDVASSSHWRWQIEVDGVPAALFGGDAEPGDAECSVWLFCTDMVTARPFELIRGIKTCIDWGKHHWPSLVIEAEPRDQRQKRFLDILGFSVRASFARDGRTYEELAI